MSTKLSPYENQYSKTWSMSRFAYERFPFCLFLDDTPTIAAQIGLWLGFHDCLAYGSSTYKEVSTLCYQVFPHYVFYICDIRNDVSWQCNSPSNQLLYVQMFSYENHEHQHYHCTYNLDKEVNQLTVCLGLSVAIEDLINIIEKYFTN